MIAALLFIIPLAGLLLSCIAAKRSESMRDSIYRSELALVFVLALAAVIGVYTYEHYQNNRANRDGMLVPQLIILGILAAVNVFWGILQIYALIVS